MSSKSVVDQIRHYQRDIERCPENSERMIRCIQRLYVLPIQVQHLQETGVGRSVNSLRKFASEVGEAAKALVMKWKAMVAAEESDETEAAAPPLAKEPPDQPRPPPTDSHGQKSRSRSGRTELPHKRAHSSNDKKKSGAGGASPPPLIPKETASTPDLNDKSPTRKKRKKNCVKERRKAAQPRSESSSAAESPSDGSCSSSDQSAQEDEDSDRRSSSTNVSSPHKLSTRHTHNDHKESREEAASKSSRNSSSAKSAQKSVKQNEVKVKQERHTASPSSSATKHKSRAAKVKAEANDDGSIDAGSGFSFADVLAGLGSSPKKKKKSQRDESPRWSSSHRRSGDALPTELTSSNRQQAPMSASPSTSSSSFRDLPIKREKSEAAMPELLRRPIKMENLDLDINSSLPEINPHYRPLPHIPDSTKRNSSRTAANEEEMFNMMMNKNQRTKVFSGAKSSSNLHVPSLFDLCIKLLYDNIDGLEYTGGVPFDLLKPLLEKLNPDQLFVLEHYNAYLIEDTGSLWEFHCKKDFRSQKRQDMESWRELYIRCMEEREEKLKALTQNISQSIAQSMPVRKAKLAYVDSAVKPPRGVARQQARYGTAGGDSSPIMRAHAAEKREILNKAVIGAHNPTQMATTTVPAPPSTGRSSNWSAPASVSQKKRKAPLMAKALQLIKGNRFKR